MFRILSLAVVLFVFWLLLSGHFSPFLVISGAVLAGLVAWLVGGVFGTADEEGVPLELVPRGLLYWPWLVAQAIKAALNVAAIIVNPALPITPQLIRVKTSQKTAIGTAIYANSITLTPGTVTVEVNRHDDELLVHALTRAGAEGLAAGEMDRRVTAMEGRR